MRIYLKPEKWKVIISLAVLVVWWAFNIFMSSYMVCKCAIPDFSTCTDYYLYQPFKSPGCHCGCVSMSTVLKGWAIILAPGIITYLIMSIKKDQK